MKRTVVVILVTLFLHIHLQWRLQSEMRMVLNGFYHEGME